jgi:transposase InsO family protein
VSARAIRDAELIAAIHEARQGYRSRFGVRKMWKQLRRNGVTDAGRERVARLMRQEGLRGVQRGRTLRTTRRNETAASRAEDLVNRDFTASRPNQLWVADLTYVRTWQGFAYLAFILDVYIRMICGWQLATHMRSDLVVDALEMAIGLRQPQAGLIAHTDRGSQYTSLHYTDRLDEHGIAPSLGSRGDAYDNAMAEAWSRPTRANSSSTACSATSISEHETLQWVSFYNDRLHKELADLPPSEYEQLMTPSERTVQPARNKDAPASVNDYKETTKTSLH